MEKNPLLDTIRAFAANLAELGIEEDWEVLVSRDLFEKIHDAIKADSPVCEDMFGNPRPMPENPKGAIVECSENCDFLFLVPSEQRKIDGYNALKRLPAFEPSAQTKALCNLAESNHKKPQTEIM
ncbi:MAG: hypothetical protein ACOH5I_21965 [Oligoflexus sp.]